MKKCLNCSVEFEGNPKAKFHSTSCRVLFNRKKGDLSSEKETSPQNSTKPEKPQPQRTDLDRILAEINKKYGVGTVFRASELLKKERLSTGITILDEKMGGGFPEGRVIELYGQPMAGKSLISLLTIAQAQKKGGKCIYFDCEDTFDPIWAEELGVDMDNLSVFKTSRGEDTFDMLFKALEGRPKIIVVDSVDSMVVKSELENDVEKVGMALKARLMSKAMRMLTPKNKGTLIIFINQLRSTMAMYGPKFTTPGGLALKFYSSIRLEVKKSDDIHEDGKKTLPIIGQVVSFRVTKNKTAIPQQVGSFKFYYDGKVEG